MIQHQNKKYIYIHDMMILRSEKKMKNKQKQKIPHRQNSSEIQ
jgi:hypothetical protein